MKKIIVFRSIRPESIGFLIPDILKRFGHESNITIITRPENAVTMKKIPNVKDVICFSGSSFHILNSLKGEIAELKKNKFDITIIPTSGNLDSYDNIVDFSNKVFGPMPTYYYRFPGQFVEYRKNSASKSIKAALKIVSAVATIPLIVIYFMGIILCMLWSRTTENGSG